MFIMSIVLLTRNNVMLTKRISILTVKPPTIKVSISYQLEYDFAATNYRMENLKVKFKKIIM